MSFDYLMSYILSIPMCMQNFITIFHSVQEIRPLSLFQNLALGKASTDDKCHFAIPWARFCQYQCVCKILSKYSSQFKRYVYFHFFRIWRSAKPRPMINVISQSLGLDVVNINVYANFYQKYSKRFKSYWHFSWTGRGQNLHKLSRKKIKCLIIRYSVKVNLQLQLTFLESCNMLFTDTLTLKLYLKQR